METIELSFKDERVRRLVTRAFPDAKTRRPIKLRLKSSYHVEDYWDGGSRNYAMFVRLADLSVLPSTALPKASIQQVANPFKLPIADVTLTGGFVVVEHCIFCGKDLGYRIYAAPQEDLVPCLGDLAPKQLPAPIESQAEG